eukprot:sb/3470258/
MFCFSMLLDCPLKPDSFWCLSEEPASQVSEQRTFFRGSTLKGSVKCLGDALKTKSNYTLHVWSFKTKCYSTVLDSTTQQRVSRYVNFFLGQSGEPVEDYTNDCRSTRCYSMDITCDSARPTIPEIGNEGARLCPGYSSIQAQCVKAVEDKAAEDKAADDSVPAGDDGAESNPDLATSSGERVLVTKSGWPLNQGQIPLVSYIGGNLSCH